jgi:hypothetical protein
MDTEATYLCALGVQFTPSELIVGLADGRRIATPLEWYPRLAKASGAQRENYEISPGEPSPAWSLVLSPPGTAWPRRWRRTPRAGRR